MRPLASKAVFGSAPPSSWSRSASGMRGVLRRAIGNLLGIHYGRPHTKIPTLPDEAELRLHAGSLAVEPGLGVGRALVGLIRALLALEVDLEIAPATRGRIIGIPLSLGSEALHRGPRLDESTIDAEVFARQVRLWARSVALT